MRDAIRLVLAIFAVSIFVHFLWEMLQSFAYDMTGIPLERVVLYHLFATVGDGVLMLVPYGAVALWRRDPRWMERVRPGDAAWVVTLGLLLSVAIEWHALATGRWHYTEAMPLIPGLGVGLLPVLQLIVLPFPIYWAAARLAGKPAGGSLARPKGL